MASRSDVASRTSLRCHQHTAGTPALMGPLHPPSPVMEELPPAITKACGRIFHYLEGGGVGGPSCSRAVVSEEGRAARQKARYDRRNTAHRFASSKSDAALEWVRNNPDLAMAWALDRSVTTAETAARRRRHLDSELAKISKEWSLSNYPAGAGGIGYNGLSYHAGGGGVAPSRAAGTCRRRLPRPSGVLLPLDGR
ncbi:hypothetical protein VPH35_010783 [Triticum aestivum]